MCMENGGEGGKGEGVLIPKDPKTPFNTIEEL